MPDSPLKNIYMYIYIYIYNIYIHLVLPHSLCTTSKHLVSRRLVPLMSCYSYLWNYNVECVYVHTFIWCYIIQQTNSLLDNTITNLIVLHLHYHVTPCNSDVLWNDLSHCIIVCDPITSHDVNYLFVFVVRSKSTLMNAKRINVPVSRKYEVDRTSHVCSICSMWFRNDISLRRHIPLHMGLLPYTCDECSKSFRWLVALKHHQQVLNDGSQLLCKSCGQQFESHCKFRRHSCAVQVSGLLVSDGISKYIMTSFRFVSQWWYISEIYNDKFQVC